MQQEFSKYKRLEYNVFMLKYCIASYSKVKRKPVVTAGHFSKTFDSIDKKELMQTLVEHKSDPSVIDVVSRLYTEGVTNLTIVGKVWEKL